MNVDWFWSLSILNSHVIYSFEIYIEIKFVLVFFKVLFVVMMHTRPRSDLCLLTYEFAFILMFYFFQKFKWFSHLYRCQILVQSRLLLLLRPDDAENGGHANKLHTGWLCPAAALVVHQHHVWYNIILAIHMRCNTCPESVHYRLSVHMCFFIWWKVDFEFQQIVILHTWYLSFLRAAIESIGRRGWQNASSSIFNIT